MSFTIRNPASGCLHTIPVVKLSRLDSDIQLYDLFQDFELGAEFGLRIAYVVQTLVYHEEHGRESTARFTKNSQRFFISECKVAWR